jgi:hypothetical protein
MSPLLKHGWRLQLFTALLAAAFATARSPRARLWRLSNAVSLWLGSFARDRYVAFHLAKKRLDCCKKCPVFYEGNRWRGQTCGNPFDKKYPDLGCYCYQPLKVNYADARCYLDERARNADGTPDEHGWEYNRCA